MTRKLSLLVATCFFLCRAQGNAQGTTGSIWGTVRDQQGAVVPGATVRAVNEETGMMRTAVADLAGRYAMPSLSPGNYRVSASRDFRPWRTGIVLTVAREAVPGNASFRNPGMESVREFAVLTEGYKIVTSAPSLSG